MAVYNRLHVRAGGGVQDEPLKAEPSNDLSIFIGLGGTGKDAVRSLKQKVYKNLKPDNPDSPVSTYKKFKYLVVDLDDISLSLSISDIDKSTEYFDISNRNIKTTVESAAMIKARKELSWLNYKQLVIRDDGNITGGVRQIGRFCLIDKAELFRVKLKSLIEENPPQMWNHLNIHIFSGICGMTGGGSFLDVCYIARYVLTEMNQADSLIIGHFFLPDVNLSIPCIGKNPLHAESIKQNGYAALKELDYLMDLRDAHDRFVQDYGSFKVDTDCQPVDMCCLISAASWDGTPMPNGYDHAIGVATDHVISFLSKDNFHPELNDDPYNVTMRTHILSLSQGIRHIQKEHGAFYGYTFVGAASAKIPVSDMVNYLGAKLFEQFKGLSERTPTDKDLMDFISANELSYEDLRRKLLKDISPWIPFQPDLTNRRSVSPDDPWVISCGEAWKNCVLNKMEVNRRLLSEELKSYDIPEMGSSVISCLFSSLYLNYALNPSAGPFFAMKLLGGQYNMNLLHLIDNHKSRNQDCKEEALSQGALRETELEAAKQAFRSASFINRRKRTRQYLEAVNNWYAHLVNLESCRQMEHLLTDLRKQIVQLYKEFFLVMTTVLDTLSNTFADNLAVLSENNQQWDPFARKILTVWDIKSQLDEEVEKLDAGQETQRLVQTLFQNQQSWICEDEQKIAKLISDYITQRFRPVLNKEMTDYLREKYQTADALTLTQLIQNEIFENGLKQQASPLFWKNPQFNLSETLRHGYIFVPFNSPETVAAAQKSARQWDRVLRSKITDTIFMMEFYCGVPLYAYQGLAELEKAYENRWGSAGIHLYENEEMDWREYLPSPYPASLNRPPYLSPEKRPDFLQL